VVKKPKRAVPHANFPCRKGAVFGMGIFFMTVDCISNFEKKIAGKCLVTIYKNNKSRYNLAIGVK